MTTAQTVEVIPVPHHSIIVLRNISMPDDEDLHERLCVGVGHALFAVVQIDGGEGDVKVLAPDDVLAAIAATVAEAEARA